MAAKARKTLHLLLDNSLWLTSFMLMIASMGLDGAYMSRWMMPGWEWSGYVLNTTADIAALGLMYWYGRLRMDKSTVKQRNARPLFWIDMLITAFSWFFSWRQLLLVLPEVEGDATWWVAIVAGLFIPLLLGAIGYAQSLIDGRIERPKQLHDATMDAADMQFSNTSGNIIAVLPAQAEQYANIDNASAKQTGHECQWCGRKFGTVQALSAHGRFCKAKPQGDNND